MTPALIAAIALLAATTPSPTPSQDEQAEPLPPGAPSDAYELSAWCYGALNEYLLIYDRVKPDLRDIDKLFGGDHVAEAEPYAADIAAARDELKMIGQSVTLAEQASPRPIAERGAAAMRQGQGVWSLAETRTERELARAWLMWALPDKCDSTARDLATRSIVLGKALSYNADQHVQAPAATAPRVTPAAATALAAAPTALTSHQAAAAPPPPAAAISPQPPMDDAALAASSAAAVGPPSATMAVSAAAAPPTSAPPSPAANVVVATQPAETEAAPEPALPPGEVVGVSHASQAPPPADRPSPQQTTAAPPAIAPPGVDEPQEPTL